MALADDAKLIVIVLFRHTTPEHEKTAKRDMEPDHDITSEMQETADSRAQREPRTPGEAGGLEWEIAEILASRARRRVLVVLPEATRLMPRGAWWPGRRRRDRARQESAKRLLNEAVGPAFGTAEYPLPEGARLLYFDRDAQRLPLCSRRFKGPLAGLFDAVAPVYRSLGHRPPGSNWLLVELRYNRLLQIVLVFVASMLLASHLSP
jgi:hypothetical protein